MLRTRRIMVAFPFALGFKGGKGLRFPETA